MIAQIQMRRGTSAEWAAAAPVVLAVGEMGYDTTLKHTKIGDGTTAWTSLPWIDVGSNTNVLHNWDFRYNPVNQRVSSGAISSGYFYDRWLRYAGTITIASTYLSLPADASIEQRIEGNGLSGAAVCVSVMLGGAVISGIGTFPTSAGSNSVTLTGFGTATLGYATGYMYVRFTATSSTRQVQAVKLELGAVSTLAYDPPMDYGPELLKCKRQLASLNPWTCLTGWVSSSTGAHGYIKLDVELRIDAPTLVDFTDFVRLRINGTNYDVNVTEIWKTVGGIGLGLSGTSLPIRESFVGEIQNDTAVFISAEL